MPIWFDESEMMTTAEVTRVYDDTVKPVPPGFGLVSSLVEELAKINFEGEFEAIVDLRRGSEPKQ